MKDKTAMARLVIALTLAAAMGPARAAEEADRDLPEPETFLIQAAQEMRAFHDQYKSYARDWYRLGFDYAYPTYRITDSDIWPRPADKNRWRPRGSHFTYVIVKAAGDAFLIEAIGDDKKVAYELRQGMDAPRKLH